MRTNKTSITIDGDKFNFYFEKSGGNKGAGITGEKDDKYYQSGMLMTAGSDEKYQVVQYVNEGESSTGADDAKKGYLKLDDASKFIDAIRADDDHNVISTGTVEDKPDQLGVNKKAEDIQEIAVISRTITKEDGTTETKIGTNPGEFFLSEHFR